MPPSYEGGMFVELFICARTQAMNPTAPTFYCIVNGLSLVRPELSATGET